LSWTVGELAEQKSELSGRADERMALLARWEHEQSCARVA